MNTGKFTKTYNVQPNEQQKAIMNTYLKAQVEGALLGGWNVEVIVDKNDNLNNGSVYVYVLKTKGYKTFQENFNIGPRGGMTSLR